MDLSQGGRGGPGHLGNIDRAAGTTGAGFGGFLGEGWDAGYRQKGNGKRGDNATGFMHHYASSPGNI
ncbi:hypothetical protein WH91_14835 [Devosia psychrophila]|uniref:Uncharacterized protein n=1 Tax=Devosia psychrophila TaxID=728005 RepID=A0ABR5DWB6_9HYPH|nr:hypothetical protein WH91_14835 [Devosia psychrophila]